MLALAAFYAPRGLSPEAVLSASPAKLAFLTAARTLYFEQAAQLITAGVAAAFSAEEAD